MKYYVEKRGATLALNPHILVNQILSFIELRQSASVYEISNPGFEPIRPDGWTLKDESLWISWVYSTCPMDSWIPEIMDPVFGSDIRLWESTCEGWRSELVHYLPWWIQRSVSIVRKFDPTYDPDEDGENENEDGTNKKEIDPYLLDHGSSKQRKRR
jgi:hypothetical protein